MSYLIIVLFFGAFIHFIYESGLAPSMRLDLREKLLRIGHELRAVEGAHGKLACVGDLRESQRRLLEAIDRIDVVALIEVDRELRGNPGLREQVEARSASFGRCECEALRRLRARTLRIALQAIAINNGGLILSILPLMPFLLGSARFRKRLLRLTVQAVDFHQQLGPAYVRVQHDVLRL
jgi:hypothetical protein